MDIVKARAEIISKLEELLTPLTPLRSVEPFAGQLSAGSDFLKKMPAALVHYSASSFSQYGRNSYNYDLDFEIWLFTNIKKYESKNIELIDTLIWECLLKIMEINEIVVQTVEEGYVDNNIMAYTIRIKYEPVEVIGNE